MRDNKICFKTVYFNFLNVRASIILLFRQNPDLTGYVNDENVNVNLFFCTEDSDIQFVGIAWLGVACHPLLEYRMALVEYTNTDATTGMVNNYGYPIVKHQLGLYLSQHGLFQLIPKFQPRYQQLRNDCQFQKFSKHFMLII